MKKGKVEDDRIQMPGGIAIGDQGDKAYKQITWNTWSTGIWQNRNE